MKKNSKTFFDNKNTIICIILILISIHYYYNYYIITREGLSLKSIGRKFKKISKALKQIKKIPKIFSKIASAIKKIIKKIKDIPKMISRFFTSFGVILKEALVDPLEKFFTGLGDVFLEIFGIFIKISMKIIDLPNCMTVYMYEGIKRSVNNFLKNSKNAYLPEWVIILIIDPIITILYDIIDLITEFLIYICVMERSKKHKCLTFNLQENVDNIKDILTKTGTDFAETFGRFNFSKLKG